MAVGRCRGAVRIGVAGVLAVHAIAATAQNVPIPGVRLLVVDKFAAAGKAKVVFVAGGDDFHQVLKGPGTDPAQIEAVATVAFDGASGTFAMPAGSRWVLNGSAGAKYLDLLAPGSGPVRVGVVRPGFPGRLKFVAKSLGDPALDVSVAPSGPVYVAYRVVNEGETTRHCTRFGACTLASIAGGTGYKLKCKGDSTGDSRCRAECGPDGADLVDLGATVLDPCTGLAWEKKDTAVGSGADFANLRDVDNTYPWAGSCAGAPGTLCQPDAVAEAACKAETPGAYWSDGCEQCPAGQGPCTFVGASPTTAWGWLGALNAAGFAGHADWRLPTSEGCCGHVSGEPEELESIVDLGAGNCTGGIGPCIDPLFGTTALGRYWSASTVDPEPPAVASTRAWTVSSGNGSVLYQDKTQPWHVRAVR